MASRKKKQAVKIETPDVRLMEYLEAMRYIKELEDKGDQKSNAYSQAVEKATRLFLLRNGETKLSAETHIGATYSLGCGSCGDLSIPEIYDILNGEIDEDMPGAC